MSKNSWRQAMWSGLVGAWLVAFPVPGAPGPAEPAPRPAPVRPTVNFNFDAADVRLLARLVGEVTGRRFVVSEKAEGKITVISPAPVPVDEVYSFFVAVLESRGMGVVERQGASFIVPIPDAAPGAMAGAANGAGLQTRIFSLKHGDAVEFAKAFEPLVRGGKAGAISSFPGSNSLLITDSADNLKRLGRILDELDQPGAARSIEVVALKHASAEDLAREVSTALSGAEKAGSSVARHIRQVAEGGSASPGDAIVVASPQSNSLVLIGTPVQRVEMKRIIALLDVEGEAGKGRLRAIFLRYLPAEDAAKSLNALLAKTAEKDQRQRIALEPSSSNNALVVDASPRDFQWVEELVRQLDRMPEQVMVEVLIAEISLGTQLDIGVDWSTVDLPKAGNYGVVGRSRPGDSDAILNAVTENVFPQGLAVGVAKGAGDGSANIGVLLQALKQNRDVKILSSVPIWAQNNAESTVSIVENIPILKSTIEGGSGTARDVIQNIDRMDVGIKLKITPHVTPDGQVTLNLNPSIEAITDEGPADQNFAPTIAKREVKTTITVPDQSTVVISGLIREDRIRKEQKVPLLGDIPLLGWLFRYTSDQTQRNNLLVFVTPRIIKGAEAGDRVRRQLEDRAKVPVLPTAVTDAPPPAVKKASPAAPSAGKE